MEKLLFRKLIADITLRALIITFTIGLIVWIIQAVNYLDFVIDDGHNFKIYFLYNLYNFPKIIHRILPFVFTISIFFELIKYEKNNELLIFWTNGVSKKKFISPQWLRNIKTRKYPFWRVDTYFSNKKYNNIQFIDSDIGFI